MGVDALISYRHAASLVLLLWLHVSGCSDSRLASSDGSVGDVPGERGAGASGAGGSGGTAGASGSGGISGSGGGPGAVRIIRGDPNQPSWFSLTIEGHGLADDEGRLVTARIGFPERPPERLGSGQVRIQSGAFHIEFPQGCEVSLYKRKVLFIDVDGDGVCTPGADRVYSDYRFQDGDITLTLADSVPAAPGNVRMLLSSSGPDCDALNQPWPEQ